MKFIYISTEASEVKNLIDSLDLKNYEYHDISSFKKGEELAKRIGFNPMSSISFNGNVPYKTIETIALDLAKTGLFTAIESFASIKKIFPKNIEERNKILSISLEEENNNKKYYKKALNLLLYSNNPTHIRKN